MSLFNSPILPFAVSVRHETRDPAATQDLLKDRPSISAGERKNAS